MDGDQDRWRKLTPLTIAVLYALIGAVWIVGSDWLVEVLVPDPSFQRHAQTIKGWFYVGVTALLLFAGIRASTRALQRSEQNAHAILHSMTEGVLVATREGLVTELNPAARSIMGLESLSLPVDAADLRRRQLLPMDGDFARTPLLRALAGEPVHAEGVRWRRTDGRELELEVSAAPVRVSRGGVVVGAVLVLRDVTEHRRLERVRDAFLSDAAHELKTPVATIKAYLQLLQRWAPHGHEPREGAAFGVLSRQCDRIASSVEKLLEVSLAETSSADTHPEAIDLAALVSELAGDYRELAPGHRFVTRADPGLVVTAERDRLETVFSNLLDNAVRFSPAGSTVELSVARRDGEAQVAIRDAGIGIPQERQARLGERFYKAHAGTSTDAGGFGVGLFLAREIVRRYGGDLDIESSPGRGTTVRFRLPLSEEPPA